MAGAAKEETLMADTPQVDYDALSKDATFRAMPLQRQRDYLSAVDKDFAGMDPETQKGYIAHITGANVSSPMAQALTNVPEGQIRLRSDLNLSATAPQSDVINDYNRESSKVIGTAAGTMATGGILPGAGLLRLGGRALATGAGAGTGAFIGGATPTEAVQTGAAATVLQPVAEVTGAALSAAGKKLLVPAAEKMGGWWDNVTGYTRALEEAKNANLARYLASEQKGAQAVAEGQANVAAVKAAQPQGQLGNWSDLNQSIGTTASKSIRIGRTPGETISLTSVERYGNPGETEGYFFSPKGEGLPEYGSVKTEAKLDTSKFYKGVGSQEYLESIGKFDDPIPPRVQAEAQKAVDEARAAWPKDTADMPRNPKTLRELSEYEGLTDPSAMFNAKQSVAAKYLQAKGFKGAEWSYEDDLSPHQYQAFDKSVINPKNTGGIENAYGIPGRGLEAEGFTTEALQKMTPPEQAAAIGPRFQAAGKAVQATADKATEQGITLNVGQSVFDVIKNRVKDPGLQDKAMEIIKSHLQELSIGRGQLLNDTVTPTEALALRQALKNDANFGPNASVDSLKGVGRAIYNAVSSDLHDAVPGMKAVDMHYGDLAQAVDTVRQQTGKYMAGKWTPPKTAVQKAEEAVPELPKSSPYTPLPESKPFTSDMLKKLGIGGAIVGGAFGGYAGAKRLLEAAP
jgi:hypothetical protein